MNYKKFSGAGSVALLIVTVVILALATRAGAQNKYEVLHKFKGGKGGVNPYAGLVFDGAGNLYGSTLGGGTYGDGVVFKLTPKTDGKWIQSVLHTFRESDGVGSYGRLTLDSAGSLYGTSIQGGAYGYGVVFKLAPNSDGTWTESVLHSFNLDGKDGFQLSGGLVFDVAGNLYGTTMYGGDTNAGCNWGWTGCGTVFKLAPNPDSSWTENVLYSFADGPDGASPATGLLFDNDGNLYGTARLGGVFKLVPNPDGSWTESVIAGMREGPSDLVFDATGNLYFTTWGYGSRGLGAVGN
ncbi:MAG TPA: choice-of-anchor tandem repeat GloVer-containing protein [Terriglobales bacterium]|jgi:uncharacterized repeat protein (TIGR03803 family)|nr:choice-of-anchor tandem repeat GloVer-containing protein [Terriglobales bacterium]